MTAFPVSESHSPVEGPCFDDGKQDNKQTFKSQGSKKSSAGQLPKTNGTKEEGSAYGHMEWSGMASLIR